MTHLRDPVGVAGPPERGDDPRGAPRGSGALGGRALAQRPGWRSVPGTERARRFAKFSGGLASGSGLLAALGLADPDGAVGVLSDPERAADAFD